MSKPFYPLLFVLMLLHTASPAQRVSVTSLSNGFRDGDCMQRQNLTRFADGDSGEGKVWLLSDKDIADAGHTVDYRIVGDTVVETRNGTRYFYNQNDGTLRLTGFDNRTSSIKYDSPITMLRYPFSYGDSISCSFTGSGIYGDHIRLGLAGRCHTVADACGIIVCGEDTLTDILRVRHHRETVRNTGYDSIPAVNTDSLELYLLHGDVMTEDIYSYYKPGYRYPLITSAVSYSRYQNRTHPHVCLTSFYAPEQQENDLRYDPGNERLRSAAASRTPGEGGDGSGGDGKAGSLADIAATSDGSSVHVHYDNLHVSLPVTLTVFDALSRQMSSTFTINGPEAGDITIPLLYPSQNVLLLHVTAGDSQNVIKIGKNF